jgi:hypothetical protein
MATRRPRPRKHRHLWIVAAGALLLITGCGNPGTPATTTTAAPATTSASEAPTTSTITSSTTTTSSTADGSTTTTSVVPVGELTLALASVSALGDSWSEQFVVRYGPEDELLGTAPGGDNGSLQLGPDYGAQAADGTWWFLDAAKQRLAHYSENGDYIDAVGVTPDLLTNGRYFQYQLPHALDNGMLVASRLGSGLRSSLLVLNDGALYTLELSTTVAVHTDDGKALYGFGDNGELLRVDPASGTVDQVEWFKTRTETRYRLTARGDVITVELPDSLVDKIIIHLVYAGDETVPAYAGVEVNSGNDGSLFLFLYGGTDSGEGGQLAGFLTILPDGVVSSMEPSRDPFSPSDPGSPAHLGVRPRSDLPWLMFVDTHGVYVYQRGGAGSD